MALRLAHAHLPPSAPLGIAGGCALSSTTSCYAALLWLEVALALICCFWAGSRTLVGSARLCSSHVAVFTVAALCSVIAYTHFSNCLELRLVFACLEHCTLMEIYIARNYQFDYCSWSAFPLSTAVATQLFLVRKLVQHRRQNNLIPQHAGCVKTHLPTPSSFVSVLHSVAAQFYVDNQDTQLDLAIPLLWSFFAIISEALIRVGFWRIFHAFFDFLSTAQPSNNSVLFFATSTV